MPQGNFIFRQKRVGQYGKIFTIFKIRTMNESGDPRIPQFGVWLRKSKADSLLELINILIGDMSFVGPRPDVEGYADCLEGENHKILMLKPVV